MATADIQDTIDTTRTAMPANVTTTHDNLGYQRLPGMSAAASSRGSIRLVDGVPSLPVSNNEEVGGRPAGETESVQLAVTRMSRVVQAGAHVIPVDAAPEPGDPTSLWQRAGRFSVITGATFDEGSDSAPLTAQPLPVEVAPIEVDQMGQYGVRFEISRREQKDTMPGELNAKIVNGIGYALAQLVDRIALEKATSAHFEEGEQGQQSAPAFSLANAAAKGLRFDELRAVVGSNGDGAAVDNGTLHVAGVPAELTGDATDTIVGDFSRMGVAIMDEVRVLVERTRLDGSIAVTCWVDAQALVPDAGYFWSAPK